MNDWIILLLGIAATTLFRRLVLYFFREAACMTSPSDEGTKGYTWSLAILSQACGASVMLSLLFEQRWLLWTGIAAGLLIIPLFSVGAYRLRNAPCSLLQYARNAHRAGSPAAGALVRKLEALQATPPAETPVQSPPAPASASSQPSLAPEEEARQFVLKIPDLAEHQRQTAREVFGVNLDYTSASIAALDQIIKRGWPKAPPAMLEPTVAAFGSYLGETIRRLHGGDWCYSATHGLHLDVANASIKIFPFAKVEKRFLNGEEDSLEDYYAFIHSEVARKSKQP